DTATGLVKPNVCVTQAASAVATPIAAPFLVSGVLDALPEQIALRISPINLTTNFADHANAAFRYFWALAVRSSGAITVPFCPNRTPPRLVASGNCTPSTCSK